MRDTSHLTPPAPAPMKLGIISDTHDYLDPRVLELFQGVDHILHAGDVGSAWITYQLEQIAPVTAVTGNTDEGLPLKETEVVELGGRKFMVHHIVDPRALTDQLTDRIARERPHAVVFGHTHKRFCQSLRNILFFNPGYAGRQRFNLERSIALLRWDENGFRPEYLSL